MESNKEKKLISVIVPIYNVENYIEECINSILNQNYRNIEIILVDDGSKDNSGKIADRKSKEDDRIKVIHQKNSGVSTARNVGIDNAKGEYICFVDGDDYLSSNYITYLYELIEKNDADVSLTPFPRKFNNSNVLDEENGENDDIRVWKGQRAAEEMLYYNIVISPWNKMVKKEIIDKYNIRFNSKLAFGEGFNFSIDCFQRANKVAVGKKKLYNYRVDNPTSAMTKFSMKLIDGSIEAQKTIKNNLVERTPKLLKACRYANWHTYCDCLNTMIGARVNKKYTEKYREVKKVCRKDAICVVKAPIPKKEKIKGLLYFINPYMSAKLINHFRLRKFTIETDESGT